MDARAVQAARQRRGNRAEELAVAYVEALGMVVVGRNVRVGHLEIDILAVDGDALVVVEVRARGHRAWTPPLESVQHVKRRRLRRAAGVLWGWRFSRLPRFQRVRFDVVSVIFGPGAPRVEHVRAAFT
jgi:putative endonuclease